MKNFLINNPDFEHPAHCASILSTNDNTIIAYYLGPECSDKQTVQLSQYRNNRLVKRLNLVSLTGNPILFQDKEQIHVVCSYFDDIGQNNETPNNPVDRWKYCSMWDYTYIINKRGILYLDSIQKISGLDGYVVRCAPIDEEDRILIPIYREKDPHGSVLAYNKGDKYGVCGWVKLGNIGEKLNHNHSHLGFGSLIQPTIWHSWHNDIYKVLCRDVTNNQRAWYSESTDCITWSKPVTTNIWNDNNSLVVIPDNKSPDFDNSAILGLVKSAPLIVWNEGPGRSQLWLGILDKNLDAIPIKQLNDKNRASYPNYCWDNELNLHIVHTDGINIAHHIFTKDEIEEFYRKLL